MIHQVTQQLNKSFLSASGPQHNKTVVCYISTWAVYRPDRGSFNLGNFDPNLCTIAIYAFAGLDIENDTIKSLGKLSHFNYYFNEISSRYVHCTLNFKPKR